MPTNSNIIGIKTKTRGTIAVLAGDTISIAPYGKYRGNWMVLSRSSDEVSIRRFLLTAPVEAEITVKGWGTIPRSEIDTVYMHQKGIF